MPQVKDDPIMEPVHKIRDDLYRQFTKSDLSYGDWLRATEKEFAARLAEVGFKVIEQDSAQCLVEVKSV